MEFSQYNVNALMEITSRPDLVFVRGQGSWLEDHAGKRYLDFVQGWAVNTLGHSAPEMQKALLDQSKLLMNPSPAFYNLPSIELATRLTGAAVFVRVFFANSGGEPNEGPIKLERKWGQVNKKERLQDHHHGPRLPRPHPGHDVGLRQAGLGQDVRAAGGRFPEGRDQ